MTARDADADASASRAFEIQSSQLPLLYKFALNPSQHLGCRVRLRKRRDRSGRYNGA